MIVLFGGTFDPVHRGHIQAALSVCNAFSTREIRLVLSARPPHRKKPVASQVHRWEMLKLACECDSRLVADDHEVHRTGPSWAIDNLRYVAKQNPGVAISWVIGNDSLAGLPDWKESQDLMSLCNLIVLGRNKNGGIYTIDLQDFLDQHKTLTPFDNVSGSIFFLQDDMLAVSATGVRRALAAGNPIEDCLDPRVHKYIVDNQLYGINH